MKTTPTEFLKLIGTPWAAYHDHPNPETAASVATIRPVGDERLYNEVCDIYGCNSRYNGDQQRARRDLIAMAPELYLFAVGMAASGDTQARMLLQKIHGETKE